MSKTDVIVIGGGMAGTAAANYLVQQGYAVTIIEKADRLGGRIRSESAGGTTVEMGGSFITNVYSNVHAFLSNTGLADKLYQYRSDLSVMRGGEQRAVTPGALIGSDILSFGAKLHGLSLLAKTLARWSRIDMQQPWRTDEYDMRSVADMYGGETGEEFLEYALQPTLGGYFYWTPGQTSEAMMLIIAKALFRGGSRKMHGGLQQLPEWAAKDSKVLLGHAAKTVRRNEDGSYGVVAEHQGKTQTLKADGVVCATTASAVPAIMPNLSERQREFFTAVQYSSTAVMTRTYKQDQQQNNKTIAFPRKEHSASAAISVLPDADASGLRTVIAYASGAVGGELCGKSDREIIGTLSAAMEPVREAVTVSDGKPVSTHVQRWPEALPVFAPGHIARLRSFAEGEIEDQNQPLVFAGDYIGGPFIEGAFTSGRDAAKRLVTRLNERR